MRAVKLGGTTVSPLRQKLTCTKGLDEVEVRMEVGPLKGCCLQWVMLEPICVQTGRKEQDRIHLSTPVCGLFHLRVALKAWASAFAEEIGAWKRQTNIEPQRSR